MSERSICKRARVSFVVEMSKTSSIFDDNDEYAFALFVFPSFFFAIIICVVFFSLDDVVGSEEPRVEGSFADRASSRSSFSFCFSSSSSHTFFNVVARMGGGERLGERIFLLDEEQRRECLIAVLLFVAFRFLLTCHKRKEPAPSPLLHFSTILSTPLMTHSLDFTKTLHLKNCLYTIVLTKNLVPFLPRLKGASERARERE